MTAKEQSHRRFNPLKEEWILVSPNRTQRPWLGKSEELVADNRPTHDNNCYLCPGNLRANGDRNPFYDSVFIFKNDYGALQPEGSINVTAEGLLLAQHEIGICHVICFSPNHALTIPEMDKEDVVKVIKVWKEQFQYLSTIPQISNVQIFENKGAVMGCSNPHPHGQVWAESSIPNEIEKLTKTQEAYFKKHGRSLLSDYLSQELKEGNRVVVFNKQFVCLVPFWAVWPYETIIIPRRHFQAITDMTSEEEEAFAEIILDITIRYDNLFKTSFPYSAGAQQRPTDNNNYDGWHFHYAFYPPLLRSATVKKFMVGYEMFANPQRDITPEQAAISLRSLSNLHYKKSINQHSNG